MSEVINNREYRQKVLRELIMELHNGKDINDVKGRYARLINGISPSEISDMEQGLIMEGMPVEEVQRLCDVHAAIFKGSIEEIHHPEETPGHPVQTFIAENRAIEKLINEEIRPVIEKFGESGDTKYIKELSGLLNRLMEIDRHYLRKENLLFPILEKHGITAPPKVMWGVDDEIRDLLKETGSLLSNYTGNKDEVIKKIGDLTNRIFEMIFKEESILFQMAIDSLSQDEWISIYNESDELGYCLITHNEVWEAARADKEQNEHNSLPKENGGYMQFETGSLSQQEIDAIFNTLPVDITFIDSNGVVKYFSKGRDRIFPRTKAVIGRKVQNCHPPASVHIVEKVIDDLKSGAKDHENFWILMGEKYVYIRYFAVRDPDGKYLGVLEFTQDIKPIKDIHGEKRLMSE